MSNRYKAVVASKRFGVLIGVGFLLMSCESFARVLSFLGRCTEINIIGFLPISTSRQGGKPIQ